MLSIFRICLTNIDFGQVGSGQLKAFPGFPLKGILALYYNRLEVVWFGRVRLGDCPPTLHYLLKLSLSYNIDFEIFFLAI